MTRFDAPASSFSPDRSAFRTAGRLCIARFGLLVAAFVPTVLALFVATILPALGAAVPAALRQAFAASPILVFVPAAASRSDADAVGQKLSAVPNVVTATLRPKEEALARLVAAGLPAPTDGRNPLPDVWTIALRGDGPLFMSEVVAARDAITAIPGVERVRFDEAWAGGLDHVMAAWTRFGIGTIAGVLVSIAAAIVAIHGLFGRALAGSPVAGDPGQPTVLVMIDIGLLLLSAAVGYGICVQLVGRIDAIDWPAMKPIMAVVGQSMAVTFIEVTCAGLLLSTVGFLLGGLHRAEQSA